MELNKRATKEKNNTKIIKNKEGGIAVYDNIYRQVILKSVLLNPHRTHYYFREEEVIEEYIKTLKVFFNKEKDIDFLFKVSQYLAEEQGRKLSPVIIHAFLYNIENELNENIVEEKYYKYFNDIIYPTPKYIADMLASIYFMKKLPVYKKYLVKQLTTKGKIFKDPEKVRKIYKSIFEKYDALTLKKWKLKRRKINTSYLIQWLRPKPKTDDMSKLYKAIIENRKEASLKEEESIIATLTSTEIDEKTKKKNLYNMVDTVPINALIRNLNAYVDSPKKVKTKIEKRLKSLLQDITNGNKKALRVFDIISLFKIKTVSLEMDTLIDKILFAYFNIEKKYGSILPSSTDKKHNVFLIDISLSMKTNAEYLAIYLVWLYYLISMNEHDYIFFFNHNLHKVSDFYKFIKQYNNSPLLMYRQLVEYFNKKIDGGTALLDAIEYVFNKYVSDELFTIFIISDEVSWADAKTILEYDIMQYKPKDSKMIFFNPVYVDGKTVIDSEDIMRIGNLTSSTVSMVRLFGADIQTIIKYIKENY